MNKEIKYEGMKKEPGQSTDNVLLHILITKNNNHKLPKTQRISDEDLERQDELGRILRDYQSFIDQIKNDLYKKDDKRWIRNNQIYEVRYVFSLYPVPTDSRIF
ncbi:hypothetical protein MKX29_01535 [Cytobacillus sp. FSL R7-0696]|uniref:hypothetical protein n=1 Tax=Cytobacillus sp. FSL R7-0696 TaxID=2921691 RepID=UPI0030FBBF2B